MKCHSYSFSLVWSYSSVSNDASDLHLPTVVAHEQYLFVTSQFEKFLIPFEWKLFLSYCPHTYLLVQLAFSICQWFEVLSHKPGSHSTGRLTSRTARGFLCEPTWDEEWETVSLYSHKGVKSKWGRKGPYWKEPFQREGTFSAPEKLWQVHKRAKRTHPRHNARLRAQPREKRQKAKEAHRCECGFKSPLATHTVGLRKIQNANKHKTKKGIKELWLL